MKLYRFLLLGLCCFPLPLQATYNGPNQYPYTLSDQGQRLINLHSSRVLDRLHLIVGINTQSYFDTFDYNPATAQTQRLSTPIIGTDISFHTGLFKNYQVGVSIPALIGAPGEDASMSLIDADAGPLIFQLYGKLNILKPKYADDFLGVAMVNSLNIPMDNGGPRLASFIPDANIEAVVDADFYPFLVALNIGYRIRSPINPPAPAAFISNDELTFGLGGHYYWEEINTTFVAELTAVTQVRAFFSQEATSPQEIFIGAIKLLPKDLNVFVGAGFNFVDALGTPRVRLAVGLSWAVAPYRSRKSEELKHRNNLDNMLKGLRANLGTEKTYKLPATSLKFRWNRWQLRPDDQNLLELVSTTLREYPEISRITIVGHTDSVGPKDMNQTLGRRRAQSIADFLIGKGIPKEKVVVTSFGEDKPVTDNELIEKRIQNRRIEIQLLFKRKTKCNVLNPAHDLDCGSQ